jgi:hypothetical protein
MGGACGMCGEREKNIYNILAKKNLKIWSMGLREVNTCIKINVKEIMCESME